MCEKHHGKCFVLTALHRLPSHLSVFIFCFLFVFFSMTVFKREIISQSMLTWLKTIILFRNIRNAVSISLSSFTGWYFSICAAWIQIW